ncbi:SLAM family member 9-like [Sinocyclocheilus anshuiensis]|uniref:SLAM family member 9-like n=1 Tax=Sinocyclocheilus anshuiensis TaxID=1608454 RepID=UPI0007B8580F|nr:PREDICTED: SLAM family member 9-like [Sinocyclocheilus anshuiensis]
MFFGGQYYYFRHLKKMIHTFVLFCLCFWRLIGVFGESVSVMEGDSVTLHTDLTEIHEDDQIVWTFEAENSLIAEINRAAGIFNTSDGPDERFRDRLKLDLQTGSLTITNTTTQHAGLYKLEIRGAILSSQTSNVSVYARLPVPVISSNSSNCLSSSSSSSSSQQNCSLVCSVVNVGHVTLSWYKGNSLLSSISVSDLSISLSLPLEVEYQDNNSYSCVLNNPISNQTQHLDISKLCHTCAVSLIVLISAAAGPLLIVAAVVICCIYRKHRKTHQEGKYQTHDEEITYADPTFYKRKAQKSKGKEEEDVVYAGVAIRR